MLAGDLMMDPGVYLNQKVHSDAAHCDSVINESENDDYLFLVLFQIFKEIMRNLKIEYRSEKDFNIARSNT